jgi:hypothetical protein
MTIRQLVRSQRLSLVCGLLAALALLGYGAGSSAGIQGSGRLQRVIAFGRITAFGSIFVDGSEYSLDDASISVNGQPGAASQLEVGQIVTVQGVQDVGQRKAAAASVAFTATVIGPVSQLDRTGHSLTVLGQTVRTDAATVFGAGIQADTFAGLQPGAMVTVSALEDAAGTLHASRVDLLAGTAALQVKGTVAALDAAARTFRLNDLTVDYSGVQVRGELANGSTATVQSNVSPAGSVLYAAGVQVATGVGGVAGEHVRMEGFITSMTSAQAFTVADQPVQTDASTHFVLHGQALAPNLAVTVHGTFTASGALLAHKVEARPQPR